MRLPEGADQVRTAPMKALRAVFAGIGQLLIAADKFREESEIGSADDHYDVFREWGRPPAPASPAGTDAAEETRPEEKQPENEPTQEKPTQEKPTQEKPPQEKPPQEKPPQEKPPREKLPKGKPPKGKPLEKELAAKEPATRRPPGARRAPGATPKREAAGKRGSGSDRETGQRSKARPTQPAGAEDTMRAGKAGRSHQAAEPRRFRSLDATGNVRVLTPDDPAELAAAGLASADRAADQPPGPLPIASYDGLSLPSLRSRLRTLDAAQLRILLDYERSNARRDDVMGMFERRITKLGSAGSDAT